MKKTKRTLLAVLLCLSGSLTQAQNWQLVWADEFTNGISPDWVFETGRGSNGWGNNELQYYRQENAFVQNGQLVIQAKRENFNGAAYTSARMKTQGRKSWKYGKMEARIAMPSFQGVWPAFWMLGDNISSVGWPSCGEIDIMEHVNTGGDIFGTIHWSDQNNVYAQYGGRTSTSITQFHTYTVEWNSSNIKWFVDGVQYHSVSIANGVNGTSEFHNNFFILLNLAIGGNWPGFSVDNGAFPANMYVDYVRVYTDSPNPPATTVATVYKDCNYAGFAGPLPVGDYVYGDLYARGIGNEDISSLRVTSGYEIQLFEHDNFTGTSLILSGDDACLVDNGWNDRTTSIKVRKALTPVFSRTLQAEDYSAMLGVQKENTTDTGGGLNVGYIDNGDWMVYNAINIPASGTYTIEYRVASLNGGNRLSLDLNAGSIVLGALTIPSTGGWQNWTTVRHNVYISAGTYNFGIFAQIGGFNLNWWKITRVSGARQGVEPEAIDQVNYDTPGVELYPNPMENEMHLQNHESYLGATAQIIDAQGKVVYSSTLQSDRIDIHLLPQGIYTLLLTQDEHRISQRFVKK